MTAHPIIPGPTYAEMRNSLLLPKELRNAASEARSDELNPLNLFNINWKQSGDSVDAIVLPKQLTGVQANIIVLSGRNFPSGSMKVGVTRVFARGSPLICSALPSPGPDQIQLPAAGDQRYLPL